jgi:hypothetical protein
VRALAALLPALLLAGPQAWEPFTARREVSGDGRHYAVLLPSRDGSEVRFALCRRREGAAAIPAVRDLPVTAPPDAPRPDFARDPGDPLLAEGALPQPPFQVRVLDGGAGLVLFERYGAPGTGDALAALGGDGRVRWRRALADLFPAEAIAAFPRSGRDLWWWQAWWVDEGRGRVVLAAAGDLFREVDLADGTVRAAGPAVLLTRVLEGPPGERADALEIAARLLPEGIDGPARRAAEDASAPLAVRVRAALALHRRKADFPAGALFRDALARGRPPEARSFAARWIGEVLGTEAIPLLREALRGEADEAWRPALEAFAGIGPPAVPVLLEMLAEKGRHLDSRGGAAHCLGAIRAAEALPALWKAALDFDPEGDEFHFVPGAALDAVVAIGPPDLRARLLGLLAEGGPHDGRIAQWIEANPGRDALPALVAALERSARFSWERKRVVAALRACTGRDHGEDASKWREESEAPAPPR